MFMLMNATSWNETRIDPSKRAGIAQWHRSSERALKPVDRPLLGEFVDLGRIHPRVDRPGHQGHGPRLCWITGLCHYRDRRQHRHAGLADRKNMRGRADHFQKFDQVIRVFIDAEAAGGERDVARVVPVGDKNEIRTPVAQSPWPLGRSTVGLKRNSARRFRP
jgi:hypothetical protein